MSRALVATRARAGARAGRWFLDLGLCAGLVMLGTATVTAAPATAVPATGKASSGDLLDPARFASLVSTDADVVVLPGARHPGPRPVVTVASSTRASAAAITAVLRDPASYRKALPSLVRSDVKATRATGDAGHVVQRLIEWELEIPLFNLEGRAWLTDRPGGVDLDLADGAFAPGQARFRVADAAQGGAILVCELRIDPRSSNWLFRRVARHNPWAETAMTAAAAWTMARAVVLHAENRRAPDVVRPGGAIVAPGATELDGTWLLGPAVEDLRQHGRLGLVRRTASGRLAQASVAVELARTTPDAAANRLATPQLWQAFPGWGHVTGDARHGDGANGVRAGTAIMTVDDDIPFVDFDAVWSVALTSRLRATAVKGATKGAVFGWDLRAVPSGTLAALSVHPRLDAAGFMERRLIQAEPLLEHALAFALAFVDAAAVADRF